MFMLGSGGEHRRVPRGGLAESRSAWLGEVELGGRQDLGKKRRPAQGRGVGAGQPPAGLDRSSGQVGQTWVQEGISVSNVWSSPGLAVGFPWPSRTLRGDSGFEVRLRTSPLDTEVPGSAMRGETEGGCEDTRGSRSLGSWSAAGRG